MGIFDRFKKKHSSTAGPSVSMQPGEQLVAICRCWEQYKDIRDGLPGIVQITADSFEAIAAAIGIILDDPTMAYVSYCDTPIRPSTVTLHGQSAGEVNLNLRADGVIFEHHGAEYYTVPGHSVMMMLNILDQTWPEKAFTFVYGIYDASTPSRREYYLSGPKSLPQGKDAFLISTLRQPDSDPTRAEIEVVWDNGQTYLTHVQNGVAKLKVTRIK